MAVMGSNKTLEELKEEEIKQLKWSELVPIRL